MGSRSPGPAAPKLGSAGPVVPSPLTPVPMSIDLISYHTPPSHARLDPPSLPHSEPLGFPYLGQGWVLLRKWIRSAPCWALKAW